MGSCHYLHSESKAVTGSALTSLFNLKRTKEEEEEKEEEGSPNQEEVKEVEVGWWVDKECESKLCEWRRDGRGGGWGRGRRWQWGS